MKFFAKKLRKAICILISAAFILSFPAGTVYARQDAPAVAQPSAAALAASAGASYTWPVDLAVTDGALGSAQDGNFGIIDATGGSLTYMADESVPYVRYVHNGGGTASSNKAVAFGILFQNPISDSIVKVEYKYRIQGNHGFSGDHFIEGSFWNDGNRVFGALSKPHNGEIRPEPFYVFGVSSTLDGWYQASVEFNQVTGAFSIDSSTAPSWGGFPQTGYRPNNAPITKFSLNEYGWDGGFPCTFDIKDVNVTVTEIPRGAPELLAPADGATVVSTKPSFSWTDSMAGSYTLEISASDTFAGAAAIGGITGTSYTLGDSYALSYETKYYWRVTSVYAGEDPSTPNRTSAARAFTTRPAPPSSAPAG
ncbi:MAG: hypothetical protein FWC55_06140, partial [Firmicutes bacterium]|nr:hypothetical protein [Bacillota bacterium]